jgi:hypothetical protein
LRFRPDWRHLCCHGAALEYTTGILVRPGHFRGTRYSETRQECAQDRRRWILLRRRTHGRDWLRQRYAISSQSCLEPDARRQPPPLNGAARQEY